MGAEKGVQVAGQDRSRAGPTKCPVGEITHQFVGSTWQGTAGICWQKPRWGWRAASTEKRGHSSRGKATVTPPDSHPKATLKAGPSPTAGVPGVWRKNAL